MESQYPQQNHVSKARTDLHSYKSSNQVATNQI